MNHIKQIQGLMGNHEIDAWLLVNHGIDRSDPFFRKFICDQEVTASAVVTQTKVHLIISPLDKDKINENDYDSVYIMKNSWEGQSQVWKILQDNSIWNLAINYSNVWDVSIDILWYGEATRIMWLLEEQVPWIQFVSSENVIYGLVDIKSEEDIEKMTIAKNRAEEILRQAFDRIKIWMTEKEVAKIVHELFENKPDYFDDLGIQLEEYSWNKALCPIVLTWENFTKWGHAMTSDTVIEKWNTIYFDFWVKLTFSDGSSFSSDIQRMWYALRDDETQAPKDIQERFEIITDSITAWIENFLPWMTWEEADKIVRDIVRERSWNDYNHATWHPIWEDAHAPWVILWSSNPRKTLKLNDNWVYTIEPRIAVKNGVSVEEMVVVSSKWNYVIWERQTELIYIKW